MMQQEIDTTDPALWWKQAVVYQVYPRSFKDSRGSGLGSIAGVTEKIDYLAELGVDAIWLSPFYPSQLADGGYDVDDYRNVDPKLGTMDDFDELAKAAHEHGIKVVVDIVPNHSSNLHEWFKAALAAAPGSPERDRYIFRDGKGPNGDQPPTDWIASFGGPAWTRVPDGQWYLHMFTKEQPDWNWKNPEVRADFIKTLRFWLDHGADGFRVDMAGSLVKEDPDHYWTKLLWQQVRAHLDETYPEAVLVSEWGDPEEALHAGFDMDFLLHFGPSHYLDLFRENPYFSAGSSEATGSAETAETEHDGERSECDGAGSSGCDSNSVVDGDNPNCNNDNVGNASGDIKAFVDTYTAMLASTAGTPGYICIPSGNHDMIRMRDTLTTDEMKLAFTFLLTMPGCPFIYYGDEIGMRYMHGLKSKEGGYERTGSRTPMQWSCATNAGFSAARPDDLYLPIDADSERPNVASQTGRSDSLLETVRALNTLRLAHPALQADGGIEFLYAEDHAYPLVYARSSEAGEAERDATDGERSGTAHETSCETPCETCSKINREAGGERIVVAINPSNTDASCTLPSDYVKLLSGGLAQEISQEPAEKTVLLSIGNPARFDGTQLHVPARSATILPC